MSKFQLTLSMDTMAGQISELLNNGGQLWYRQTPYSILRNRMKYIVELVGEKVAAVVGLEQFGNVTEIKHLCVRKEYRGRGLGKKMLLKAIESSPTNIVFGQVRSDNHINIKNNLSIGMKPIGKKRRNGYSIIIFSRRKDCVKAG